MGHRHGFSTPQMFETENDQSWNCTEQPYMHLAGADATENNNLVYPVDNMSIDGAHFPSQWNPAPRPNAYASSSRNIEPLHYQQEHTGPSHDPFLHQSAAGSIYIPDNYGHHASSSSYGGQTFQDVEGSYFDLTMGNGRGPYKRKSPGVPAGCDVGSSSRYHDAGNSSSLSIPSDLWQDKPNVDFHHTSWDYAAIDPRYRGSGLSIGDEGTLRNVRSRATLDLEADLARTHLSTNPSRHSHTSSWSVDHSTAMDPSSQSSNASAREWNQTPILPAGHDTSGFSRETNHFITGSSNPSASLEGGHNNGFTGNRNPAPPCFQGNPAQSVRGVRSSFLQRSAPTFRASSSNLRMGHSANSEEGMQFVTESYSSRHPRPWCNSDRSGRTRTYSERHRALSDDAGFRDRLASEGFVIVDRSALYGSRNLLDHHREMRLDIDDMSYEELLDLGERIGSVSTGLSEGKISKCLVESIYCSSDQMHEEGTCVICLEEYQNMDDIGMLKVCRHDFHVGCIRKWLSMKNICPICKACGLPDQMEGK